ncbi:hypothetical protein D3C80_1939980 [compost metagenome]
MLETMNYRKDNGVGVAELSVEHNGLNSVLRPFVRGCADSESAEHPAAVKSCATDG